jgi:hypothetical protein
MALYQRVAMANIRDPRLAELKRLQYALDSAVKHLDEFDARVFDNLRKIRTRAALIKSPKSSENGIAVKVAAGMAKSNGAR